MMGNELSRQEFCNRVRAGNAIRLLGLEPKSYLSRLCIALNALPIYRGIHGSATSSSSETQTTKGIFEAQTSCFQRNAPRSGQAQGEETAGCERIDAPSVPRHVGRITDACALSDCRRTQRHFRVAGTSRSSRKALIAWARSFDQTTSALSGLDWGSRGCRI